MSTSNSDTITASGVVEATEVTVAPQVSGTVVELFISEGDAVSAGEPILKLDNQVLMAQLDQANTAYDAAQSGLESAQAGLEAAQAGLEVARLNMEMAQVQYGLTLQMARSKDYPQRSRAWIAPSPSQFEMPVWYFDSGEEIDAAQAEADAAWQALDQERSNLDEVLNAVGSAEFRAAEERLAQAQSAFQVADALKKRPVGVDGRQAIIDYVNDLYDDAKAELSSAQDAYDNLITDDGAQDVLEARARVVVAYERYQIAMDQLAVLLVGENAPEISLAQLSIDQAEAAAAQAQAVVDQAQANAKQAELAVEQAEAAKELISIQVDNLTVLSPIDGVILTKAVEVGEMAQAGLGVATIGILSDLTITVYIPEDQYGNISLNQTAEVSVDSFPDRVFTASVTRIADQAEYTPRNVQTQEDRKTTVFAIQLSVDDPNGLLKPGIPADVVFPTN